MVEAHSTTGQTKLRYRYPRVTQIGAGSKNKKIAFFLVGRATVRRNFVDGHVELRKSGSVTFVNLCVLEVYYREVHGFRGLREILTGFFHRTACRLI
jgi:hypothetical protein